MNYTPSNWMVCWAYQVLIGQWILITCNNITKALYCIFKNILEASYGSFDNMTDCLISCWLIYYQNMIVFNFQLVNENCTIGIIGPRDCTDWPCYWLSSRGWSYSSTLLELQGRKVNFSCFWTNFYFIIRTVHEKEIPLVLFSVHLQV